MDNLCHTLAGAALAQAGCKRRTALAVPTLLIASNLPDLDVAVFATDTLAMSFRRGWTHGVLAMVVLPVALALAMLAWDRGVRQVGRRGAPRAPARARELLLLACLGTWLHVFMDYLNTYGVRLLMPFSQRWFYGDALYVVDPILYVVLGAALLLGRSRTRPASAGAERLVAFGLTVAAAYIGVMFVSNLWARAEVRRGLVRAGQPADTRFMETPVFGNPLQRDVVVDVGDRYERGTVWFEPWPHFRPAGYGVSVNDDQPPARQASTTPRFRAYLGWSRFPFYVLESGEEGTRVFLNDYRYAGPEGRGWATVVALVR
ncbi:MAG: metal-dependent hydrolase [Acidobacteriota bacterium]